MKQPGPTGDRQRPPERSVLFVIDDDKGVVHAMTEDLRHRFGHDFRITGETSAAAGLAALRDLAAGHESVALLIVDHNMPEMPGVDFLAGHTTCTRERSACFWSSATTRRAARWWTR